MSCILTFLLFAQNLSILHGVVLVVSKKLAQRQMELHKKALILGAECRFMYDCECTHFVHQVYLYFCHKLFL